MRSILLVGAGLAALATPGLCSMSIGDEDENIGGGGAVDPAPESDEAEAGVDSAEAVEADELSEAESDESGEADDQIDAGSDD